MSKRKPILDYLVSYQSFDQDEAEDVRRIIQLAQANPDIFERECAVGHFTASALVVNPETGKILLHKHKKLDGWYQFGGHADGETDLAAAALREAEEETGLSHLRFAKLEPIDIQLQLIPQYQETPEHYHLDVRYVLFTSATEVPKPPEGESQILRFFSEGELENSEYQLAPGLLRLIRKSQLIER